jgi:hypothetical protein
MRANSAAVGRRASRNSLLLSKIEFPPGSQPGADPPARSRKKGAPDMGRGPNGTAHHEQRDSG